jgi:hypothetical protein
MTDPELEAHRKTIAGYRRRLASMIVNLKASAQSESDDFKKHTMQWLVDNIKILDGLYAEFENQLVAQYGLKDQIELLKDIVVQLPDVVNNQEIQNDIKRLFKEYDSSH